MNHLRTILVGALWRRTAGACLPFLLTLALAGPSSVARAAVDRVPPAVQSLILPYIEQQFAALFPGPRPDQRVGSVTYRTYSGTGNAVGFDGVDLYVVGPSFSPTPTKVMSLVELCDARPVACGVTYERSALVGTVQREYLVHVSWKAHKSGQAPLVVVFHGSDQGGRYALGHYGWREVADAEGLVVAFPTGLKYCYYEDKGHNGVIDFDTPPDVRQVETKWANGELGLGGVAPLCTETQMAGLDRSTLRAAPAEDDGFVRALLDAAIPEWSVDAKRVYATGFSNGGAFEHHLAGAMADRFAAVHMHAGLTLAAPVARASRPLPLLFTDGNQTDVGTLKIGEDVYAPGTPIARYASAIALVNGSSTATHDFTGPLALPGFPESVALYSFPSAAAPPGAGVPFPMVIINGLGHAYPAYLAAPVWAVMRQWQLP